MAEPVETGPRSEGAGGGTGPSHSAAPSGRLDLDASPLRTGRLGDANREHTVVELCVDAFRVDFARKHDPELELADPARTPADDAFALALLDLAADRQLVAGNLDVHVFAVDPRNLGLDDVGVLQLLDIDRRDPSRGLVEHAPEGLIEHPPHTFVQLAELAQRAPALGSGPVAFWEKLRHLTISFHSVSISFAAQAAAERWAMRGPPRLAEPLRYWARASVTSFEWTSPHSESAINGSVIVHPSGVSEYSTRTGTSAKIRRATRPSRSSARNVSVMTFLDTPGRHAGRRPWRRTPRAMKNRRCTFHLPCRTSSAWSTRSIRSRSLRQGLGTLDKSDLRRTATPS